LRSRPRVRSGDEGHFARVLRHLVENAQDALLENQEGAARSLTIRAVTEAGRVALSVSDTSPGVPPELRERIFEPFFSTKPSTGLGLGLGMARNIAALYGGSVELEGASRLGATFRVVLPAG
jgi:signal transduction histidine kinase